MTPDNPSVDEAAAETASSADEDGAKAPTPAEAYRQALDQYLAGDLTHSLAIVDAALGQEPEDELRSRLERLRRRAEDRIVKEGGTPPPPPEGVAKSEEPAAEEAEEKEEAEEPAAESEEEAEETVEEAPAQEEEAASPAEEPAKEEPKAEEAPAKEEPPPKVETKVEPPKPEPAKVETPVQEAPSKAPASSKDSGVIKKESKFPPDPPPKRQPRGKGSGVHPARPRQKKPARKGPPPGIGITLQEFKKVHDTLNSMNKLMHGVENHTLKVAEAYQRISKHHKRKEQAYDQLYEELRQYKENFLLEAQKPLFKDIILLYDGVSRSIRTVQEGEAEQISKADVLKTLQHALDEILEVLYRRDIELIEDHPKVLDIDIQKPIRRIETEDPEEDRAIDQVIREGFRMNSTILRYQEVVVKRCAKERES